MSVLLRFITTNSLVSTLIRAFTWSDYSHVEIVMQGEGYLGAHFPDGVKIRPYDYCHPSKALIAKVPCGAETTEKVIAFARKQVDKPYDWLNIFGDVIHEDLNEEPKAWICDTLVYAAFHSAGIDLLDVEKLDRITPRDLLLSPYISDIRKVL